MILVPMLTVAQPGISAEKGVANEQSWGRGYANSAVFVKRGKWQNILHDFWKNNRVTSGKRTSHEKNPSDSYLKTALCDRLMLLHRGTRVSRKKFCVMLSTFTVFILKV